ncbi:hypothetical protein [Streptomyces sp. NPDC056982]|uniref:hypothetical protein n=1 Tax=Streptomyces sp. NPDC056982 TaxID=3345986 RepID=UPI00363EC666
MNQPYNNDDAFDQITNGLDVDPDPYGETASPQATRRKPGLNSKGRVILGAAAVVLVGGGILVYQDHAENIAAQKAKSDEIALQQQRLDIERLKITNKLDKEQASQAKADHESLQQKIDDCVKANKDQSAYLQGTVDACRDQYSATSNGTGSGADMQEAGAVTNTSSGSFDATWLVVGIGAAVGVGYVGNKFRRPAAAPVHHYQ